MGGRAALLERAIAISVEAHRGQKDRYGAPYIFHPLRVMGRVQTDTQRTVAILHDVVEDTGRTFADLGREGFPAEIIEAVRCLTKRKGEPYSALIERCAANPIARPVKIADLEDNMDLRRFNKVSGEDAKRLRKFLAAWRKLTRSSG